jgi:hypothetical protein
MHGLLEILAQKPQRDCVAISSASPVYSRVRRANGTRAGSPGPYICAHLAVFAIKHKAMLGKL